MRVNDAFLLARGSSLLHALKAARCNNAANKQSKNRETDDIAGRGGARLSARGFPVRAEAGMHGTAIRKVRAAAHVACA